MPFPYSPSTWQNPPAAASIIDTQAAYLSNASSLTAFKDALGPLMLCQHNPASKVQLCLHLLELIHSLTNQNPQGSAHLQTVLAPLLGNAQNNHLLSQVLQTIVNANPQDSAAIQQEIRNTLRLHQQANALLQWSNSQPSSGMAAQAYHDATSFGMYVCGLKSECSPRDVLRIMAISLKDILSSSQATLDDHEALDLVGQLQIIEDSLNRHREIATTDLYNLLIQNSHYADGTIEVNQIPNLTSNIHMLTDSLSSFQPGKELYWLPLPVTPHTRYSTEQYRYVEIIREADPASPLQPKVLIKVHDAGGFTKEPNLPPPFHTQAVKLAERGKKLTCAQFDVTDVIKALKGTGSRVHMNNLLSIEHLAIKFFEYSKQLRFFQTTDHQLAVKPSIEFHSNPNFQHLEKFTEDLGLHFGVQEKLSPQQPVRRQQLKVDGAIDSLLACLKVNLMTDSSYRKLKSHLLKSTLNLLTEATLEAIRTQLVDDVTHNGLNSVLKAHPLTQAIFQPLRSRWDQTIRNLNPDSALNGSSLPITLNLMLQQVNQELVAAISVLPHSTIEAMRQEAVNYLQDRIAKNEWRIHTHFPTAKLVPNNHHSLFNGKQRPPNGDFTPVHAGFARHLLELNTKYRMTGARLNPEATLSATLEGGACTAMTLTFIKQFFETRAELADKVPAKSLNFEAFKKTYQRSINGFSFSPAYTTTLQSVFNMIEIAQAPGIDTKKAKIDLLTQVVGLQVVSQPSVELDLKTPVGKAKLAHTIAHLQPGCYLIRALLQEANHKGETHGHSVFTFKDDQTGLLYYYDPNYGLRIVDNHNLMLGLKSIHKDFDTNNLRFYPVAPIDPNDSQEINPSEQLEKQINPLIKRLTQSDRLQQIKFDELKLLSTLLREAKFRFDLSTVLTEQCNGLGRHSDRTVGHRIPIKLWEKKLKPAASKLLSSIEPKLATLKLIASPINQLDATVALWRNTDKAQLVSRLVQLDLIFKKNMGLFPRQANHAQSLVPVQHIARLDNEDWTRLTHIMDTLGDRFPLTTHLSDRHANAGELALSIKDLTKALNYFPFLPTDTDSIEEPDSGTAQVHINEFEQWIAIQSF